MRTRRAARARAARRLRGTRCRTARPSARRPRPRRLPRPHAPRRTSALQSLGASRQGRKRTPARRKREGTTNMEGWNGGKRRASGRRVGSGGEARRVGVGAALREGNERTHAHEVGNEKETHPREGNEKDTRRTHTWKAVAGGKRWGAEPMYYSITTLLARWTRHKSRTGNG